jgi:gliding motility-associated-like protein
MKRFLGLLFLAVISFYFANATHNRAGEITFNQISLLTYKVQIVTYTKTSSPADRPALEINWGDGAKDSLLRISKISVGNDISRNYYEGTHTYPGPSSYTVFFEDPNRNGGVINIPGSVNIPFYVQSQIIINPVLGYNNSPILFQPPIDNGAVNQIFIHNPNAYDPDGDSLSYELIKCKGLNGLDIPGYFYPAASNSFTLNPVTGDLIWDSPTLVGEFNVAFLIKEWRNGINIGYVERDMQIDITPSADFPPVITPLNDICVTAGALINFNVTATDPDNNLITLSATGSPLDTNYTPVSPASFPTFTDPSPATGVFTWQTECVHVRRASYQILFKAQDNVNNVNLVDLKRCNITIVAPAPQNLTATPVAKTMQLNWDQEICANALGYKLYRRTGFSGYTSPTCITGVPASTGYNLIASVNGITNTSFIDDNNGAGLIPGNDYCYLVIAFFADSAESYVSNEACATLIQDSPIMTNVSIVTTDAANGSVYVAWSSPKIIDSAQTPGPFEYRLFRSPDFTGNNFTLATSFNNLNDTIFNDTGLNTKDNPWSYKVEFYNMTPGNIFKVGESLPASSVFLNTAPTDNAVNLTWQAVVPWINNRYVVFRLNTLTSSYESIDTVSSTTYRNSGLANDSTFCYKVESIGSYSADGFVNPILNFSQEKCETPIDNVKPCTVNNLNINSTCDIASATLTWSKPDASCGDDVITYQVYFTPLKNQTPQLIAILQGINQTTFTQNIPDSIPGCYYIISVDSVGNKSELSAAACAETCPVYLLPNVFTPNGDGKNDFWVPFPYKFVDHIELTVFNRWGNKVFETNDKDVMWKGTKDNGNTRLSDGPYYYICKVYELFLDGVKPRTIHGSVNLIGNK